MRVIKFKGLRTDGKGWVYGFYYATRKGTDDPLEIHIIVEDDGSNSWRHEVHPETVRQFTGLLDKNGVEIYEGDKLDNEEVVTWSIEQGCYFAGHSPLCMSASHREVIGNIHELTT